MYQLNEVNHIVDATNDLDDHTDNVEDFRDVLSPPFRIWNGDEAFVASPLGAGEGDNRPLCGIPLFYYTTWLMNCQ